MRNPHASPSTEMLPERQRLGHPALLLGGIIAGLFVMLFIGRYGPQPFLTRCPSVVAARALVR